MAKESKHSLLARRSRLLAEAALRLADEVALLKTFFVLPSATEVRMIPMNDEVRRLAQEILNG